MTHGTRSLLAVALVTVLGGYRMAAIAETVHAMPPSGAKRLAVPVGPVGGPLGPPDAPHGPDRAREHSFASTSPLAPTVQYRFPLRSNDWWHVVNYVDLDPGPGILDWDCHAVSYDGHQGHDIIVRDFVEMDEGRFALAAAPGTVIDVADGNFDRNTQSPLPDPPNSVVVQHGDGSYAYYLHLAKWSTLVYAGQSVLEGQPLGLIGSSGSSTDPHLHFETQQSSVVYEPSAGACRTGTSLWKTQMPNVYDNPVAAYDLGQTTVVPTQIALKSRPPNVTHIRQTAFTPPHYVWYKLTDVHVGDTSRVIWRRPDNTVYSDTGNYSHPTAYSYAWQYWSTTLPSSGSLGTWTVQFFLNGVLKGQLNFSLDLLANQFPVASGRAVAVPKGVARDTLNGSDADSDLREFRLVTNPTHGEVTLSGPRGRYFSYVPESGYSGSDTWQFKVVDGQGVSSTNSTMTMSVSPVLENALRLEGDDDYVAVPGGPGLDVASFTLEAWIRRTAGSSSWQAILDRRHPTILDTYGYSLFLQPDSRLKATAGNGASSFAAVGSTRIPLDRWVHVAATYGGGALQVFVNGVPDGSTAFPGPIAYSGVGELRIGGSFVAGDSFRGEIEEARLWSVARDPSQLQQGATCAFFDNPLPATVHGSWRFQGDANDASPNGNHGSRIAGASFLRTDSAFSLSCLVQNLDGDSHVDGLDNCPLDVNDGQADAEADGIGDLCDPCPSDPRPGAVDSDRDGVGDRCDDCPFLGNTEQADGDADGAGDLCDPAPTNNTLSVPSDQVTLSLSHDQGSGVSTLTWTPGAFAATYDVYRGSQSDLQVRFYGTCQNSRDGSTADTAFAENETPSPGAVFYFLVVGVASDGTRGLARVESDGRQRDLRAKDCI